MLPPDWHDGPPCPHGIADRYLCRVCHPARDAVLAGLNDGLRTEGAATVLRDALVDALTPFLGAYLGATFDMTGDWPGADLLAESIADDCLLDESFGPLHALLAQAAADRQAVERVEALAKRWDEVGDQAMSLDDRGLVAAAAASLRAALRGDQ
ncbi:hypothetical protein [Blastococcus sp. SYSU D00813]